MVSSPTQKSLTKKIYLQDHQDENDFESNILFQEVEE